MAPPLRHRSRTPRQTGLTLIELLVALALSLLVALAAATALVVARGGFAAVDAASQLRDNGRFASDLIQRLAVQTGYKDLPYATTPAGPATAALSTDPDPNITGFNNALLSATDPLNKATARSASVVGYGSDILILRYQAGETFPGSGVSDKTMIDCAGFPANSTPADRYDRMVSILHVGVGIDGEPSLMCMYLPSSGKFKTHPIIQGVENFQVLYGTDGVTPNTAPPADPAAGADSVPERYLRADQMTVAGDAEATNRNWRRVRSLRIGMVLRGPPNSAQDKSAQTLYPLGLAKASTTGASGSALSSTSDAGTVFKPPADGRLRQVVTFTVHLRNDQGL
ncbi:MAG: PilW family protein [Proteobacteria bacterium]|nr:PilW family protein [Pseudomonadota bacterium]